MIIRFTRSSSHLNFAVSSFSDKESTRWDSSSADSCCFLRVSYFCRASTSEEERAGSEACLSWLGLCEFFIWFSELASGV